MSEHQLQWGRDALFDLLRTHGLLVKKGKRKVKTTLSHHWLRKYANLIKEWEPLSPNTLWVSDITYIVCADGFAYLSLITDAYSHKIVGFCLWQTLEAAGCIKALQMALQGCPDTTKLIHHSDRGVQYCSEGYVNLLSGNNILISMTENRDPLQNAIAERVNGILKDELLQQPYGCYEQAQKSVAAAIEVYNTLRPHSSCDMLTPQHAHQQSGVLKKHWKNYYQQKEVEMTESG